MQSKAPQEGPREFWIDVGGTFTDCIARTAASALITHKLLSSGVYRGRVGPGSTPQRIIDATRQKDPPGFFEGFTFTLLDPATVADSDRSPASDLHQGLITHSRPHRGRSMVAAPFDSNETVVYKKDTNQVQTEHNSDELKAG